MNKRLSVVGVMVAIVAACSSTTDPVTQGEVAQIINIVTPARSAASETLKVSFTYVTSPCDTGATLEVRDANGTDMAGLRFTARSFPTERACTLSALQMHAVSYGIGPGHFMPMRLIFSEPDGNDTVRVVGL
jgi:hypothetical protein